MGIGNNWDHLIRLIVPLSFALIWAVTSLFNREGKPTPSSGRMLGPPGTGPRPGDPTMRWGPTGSPSIPGQPPRRAASNDNDILIIRPAPTPTRPAPGRSNYATQPARKPAKPAKAAPPQPRRPEPRASTTPKLAGVSQNVNQHLTRSSIELTPLDPVGSPSASAPLGLASASTIAMARVVPTIPASALAAAMRDPARLREAFVLNELLKPPLALRPRAQGRI